MGRLGETQNFACFFNWSIECVEKKDFAQLITSLKMRTKFDTTTQSTVKLESALCIIT